MNLVTKKLEILGESFQITNQRVLFWEKESALILSDLHVGKSAFFRKNGIALPSGILENDIRRLHFLLDFFSAKKLIINGDLLHAGRNSEVEFFCKWRKSVAVEFHLIMGNHDRLTEEISQNLGLNSQQKILEMGDFCFVHDFEKGLDKFQITGHIHPGILLKSRIKNLRLPCFVVTNQQLLLPAFSEFTGLDTQNIPSPAKYFVFTEDEIFEI